MINLKQWLLEFPTGQLACDRQWLISPPCDWLAKITLACYWLAERNLHCHWQADRSLTCLWLSGKRESYICISESGGCDNTPCWPLPPPPTPGGMRGGGVSAPHSKNLIRMRCAHARVFCRVLGFLVAATVPQSGNYTQWTAGDRGLLFVHAGQKKDLGTFCFGHKKGLHTVKKS